MTEQPIVGLRFRIDCVVVRAHEYLDGVYYVVTTFGEHLMHADEIKLLASDDVSSKR